MQPDEQQPGWKYTPDNAKPAEPGTLSIDHSQENPQEPAPSLANEPPAEPPPAAPAEPAIAPPEPAEQAAQTTEPAAEVPQPAEPAVQDNPAQQNQQEVVWTASEYIHHDRGMSWFAGLFGLAIVVSGITYLITKDIATSVIFIILAGIVAGFASRKPADIQYRVATDGVHIAQKFYPFNVFKSFSIIYDGGLRSVMLTPLKRFMPPVSMFYSPDNENRIVELLGDRLPQAQAKPEAVERLARRLKI